MRRFFAKSPSQEIIKMPTVAQFSTLKTNFSENLPILVKSRFLGFFDTKVGMLGAKNGKNGPLY